MSLFQGNRICNSTQTLNWYLLKIAEQRVYLGIMHYSQQSRMIRIGGITPLNLETCVSVRA